MVGAVGETAVPMDCVIESWPENNCKDVCERGRRRDLRGERVRGATAFGHPGVELEALSVCGESTPEVRAAVVHIEGPCDAELVFEEEESSRCISVAAIIRGY